MDEAGTGDRADAEVDSGPDPRPGSHTGSHAVPRPDPHASARTDTARSDAGYGDAERTDAARLGERLSLREQVARAIRAALIAGDMRPGVVYSAPGLATRFGVSATPVREALLDLAKDGLVEPVRNKGFRVRALSAQDADEIHRLRRLLEIPTVADIARDGCADALPTLRGLADDIVAAAKRGDALDYVTADQRFHAALLELSGNMRLVRIVVELRSQARLYRLRTLLERGEVGGAADEHHELLDLIEARDPDAVTRLMERHLMWTRRMEPEELAPRGSDAALYEASRDPRES